MGHGPCVCRILFTRVEGILRLGVGTHLRLGLGFFFFLMSPVAGLKHEQRRIKANQKLGLGSALRLGLGSGSGSGLGAGLEISLG